MRPGAGQEWHGRLPPVTLSTDWARAESRVLRDTRPTHDIHYVKPSSALCMSTSASVSFYFILTRSRGGGLGLTLMTGLDMRTDSLLPWAWDDHVGHPHWSP